MIITVAGGKGGIGKSMVATSLAVEYMNRKKKTFLLDADVECPNDHLVLNIPLKKEESIEQVIPKWDFSKCIQCGRCSFVCKQNAIVFVPSKNPAFIPDVCIGCKACMMACPTQAISESKKEIGRIYSGEYKGIRLISGELKLGQPTSGEVVMSVRKYAYELSEKLQPEIVLIDAPAGMGCPVIAALSGTDYLVAVTEPTPSALHDLKRSVYLARHFTIPIGIVINKFDLEESFYKKIEKYAASEKIPIIGKIPYHKNFVTASIKMTPVLEMFPQYRKIFDGIIQSINR